jgi:hypothetical protein
MDEEDSDDDDDHDLPGCHCGAPDTEEMAMCSANTGKHWVHIGCEGKEQG